MSFLQQVRANQISIHALREEGDTLRKRVLRPRQRFLSTPSARRATMCLANIDKRMKISIHALREEGDVPQTYRRSCPTDFYPRPPRGGRPATAVWRPQTHGFLSTPSARRATKRRAALLLHLPISIHALREEGDQQEVTLMRTPKQFLSTPSARRATFTADHFSMIDKFLSTPSARRATRSASGQFHRLS